MSKTIKQRSLELKKREDQLRIEIERNEGDIRSKAKRIGKIALLSGGFALAFLGIYKLFFQEATPSKKNKKMKESTKKQSETLSQLATPFIVKFLNDYLDLDEDKTTSV